MKTAILGFTLLAGHTAYVSPETAHERLRPVLVTVLATVGGLTVNAGRDAVAVATDR